MPIYIIYFLSIIILFNHLNLYLVTNSSTCSEYGLPFRFIFYFSFTAFDLQLQIRCFYFRFLFNYATFIITPQSSNLAIFLYNSHVLVLSLLLFHARHIPLCVCLPFQSPQPKDDPLNVHCGSKSTFFSDCACTVRHRTHKSRHMDVIAFAYLPRNRTRGK